VAKTQLSFVTELKKGLTEVQCNFTENYAACKNAITHFSILLRFVHFILIGRLIATHYARFIFPVHRNWLSVNYNESQWIARGVKKSSVKFNSSNFLAVLMEINIFKRFLRNGLSQMQNNAE